DTTRNAMWMSTGAADSNVDATVINAPHSGVVYLYKFTKTVNSGVNWGWTQLCGFGASAMGTGVAATPATSGPGSLSGQETPTPTTSSAYVDGIPCSDSGLAAGGVSSGGITASCGLKFPFAGYDATNDVFVLFAGSWSNGTQCEVILYYPSAGPNGTWKHPYG